VTAVDAVQPAARYAPWMRNPAQAGFHREATMRFILGVVVGAALVLASAFLHDTGVVRAGPKQPFVNWDTVAGMMRR
jgi:hypothetical protein